MIQQIRIPIINQIPTIHLIHGLQHRTLPLFLQIRSTLPLLLPPHHIIHLPHKTHRRIDIRLDLIRKHLLRPFEKLQPLTIPPFLHLNNPLTQVKIETADIVFLGVQFVVLSHGLFVAAEAEIPVGFELVEEGAQEVVEGLREGLQLVEDFYGLLEFALHEEDGGLVEEAEVL